MFGSVVLICDGLPKETSQNVGFHLLVAPPFLADSHVGAPGSRPSTVGIIFIQGLLSVSNY